MGLCFKMDEKLFGDVKKEVRGVTAGASYEISYVPSKDIAGDYWVDVSYGMMAGLDPNRALVFGLQARGDKLISRDFLRRQMPWDMNVTQEEEKVEVEELRDSLMQAMASYAQALPAMAAQGQDPTKILTAMAAVIKGRQTGDNIEDLVVAAFAPPPVSPEEAAAGEPPAPGVPGQAPAGALPQPPQAPSALQQLAAGLSSSGQPNLSANVTRRQPA